MWFIGDVHGKVHLYEKILKGLPEGSKSIQIGDMGVGFEGVRLYNEPNSPHRFIRGNHDSPSACRAHRRYLGDFGYLPEEGIFYLGGAWSIDAQWRTPGESWWADEELSPEAFGEAQQLYQKVKPRIVVTHEAPTKAALEMLYSVPLIMEYTPHEPCPCDQSMLPKGEDYKKYKAGIHFANTRTSQALQFMLDTHAPEHWVFGHYHRAHSFEIRGCQFTCIPELGVKEIA